MTALGNGGADDGRGSRGSFELGDLDVAPGTSGTGELPLPRLVTGTPVALPVRVLHGRHDGPTMLVSSAIHGDELGGVEVIRRVTERLDPATLHGTVVLVPIVNVHGFLTGDRYLPDRRDLNRSFPGSSGGSLASRIAHVFMDQLVSRCDVGIDLHTGSDHRTNLPQVRADLDDPTTRDLAEAFGAPIMLHARLRDGSLRAAGVADGTTMLLFEGGEALRFDESAIRAGTKGILRVAHRLGMVDDDLLPQLAPTPPLVSRRSRWVRARRSGVVTMQVELGDRVEKGQPMSVVHDVLGRRLSRAGAPFDGVVVGQRLHPLVHQGDALVHVAEVVDAPAPRRPDPAATTEPADPDPAGQTPPPTDLDAPTEPR